MDRHVWWLRRRVLRAVARAVVLTGLVGAAVAHAAVMYFQDELTEGFALDLLPLSILAGQALALLRFALAMVANPLTLSYMRRYSGGPPAFAPGAVFGEPDPIGELLVEHGFVPALTVRDEPDAATVVDLYQSTGALVTAAVSRRTGQVSLLTGLSDGRILHTAAFVVPPHEQLVVNTVARADTATLMDSHKSVLGVLALRSIRPCAATPRVWLQVTEYEHQSYHSLGPVVGACCNLSGAPSLGRLLVKIPADDVLELALPSRPELGVEPGVSRLAHAFGAAAPA